MQMIHPLHAGAPRPALAIPQSLDQRLEASRLRAKRRWILRTAALLLLTAAALILIVIWRRDSLTAQSAVTAIKKSGDALQARVNTLGVLPAVFPNPEMGHIISYAGSEDRFYAANTTAPVVIATSGNVDLILAKNGRAVLIYQQGKVSARWMSSSEFLEALARQRRDLRAFLDERSSRPPQLP